MSILLIGLNHRTAPVEVREQLAFSRDGAATALLLFRNQFPQCEAAILSTCNRVELLVASATPRPNIQDVVSFLAQARDVPVSVFQHLLYKLSDEQAIRHFFRVAGGLDSMVVGESQILSQVKQCYAMASEQGTTGRLLNRLFHHAFFVAKRVHSETQVGAGKLSIPSVAVDVAKQIFTDFSDKEVLVVGAGEMARLCCEYLRDANATRFTVTTRTLANARTLAEACGGVAVPFDELDAQLAKADVVITASACPSAFVTPDRVRAAQKARHHRPLFMIDLAVPHNIAPDVGELPQVFVYDVDDLGRIVQENQQQRDAQTAACEKILDEEIEALAKWISQSAANPLIQQMYSDAHDLTECELGRLFALCPDLTDEQRAQVTQLAERLVNKVMYPCVSTVRRHTFSEPSATLADTLHQMTARETTKRRPVARPRTLPTTTMRDAG